jgi:hypothetical protein
MLPAGGEGGHLACYQQAGGWVKQKRNGNTLALAENVYVILPRPQNLVKAISPILPLRISLAAFHHFTQKMLTITFNRQFLTPLFNLPF